MRRLVPLLTISLIAALAVALPTKAQISLDLPLVSLEEALALADVELPTDGTGLILHADFPAETPFVAEVGDFTALTLNITPSGVQTMSAVPSSAADEGGTQVEECTDPAFQSVGKQWSTDDLPIEFAINHRTVPDYMSPWLTTRSVREAHQAWGLTNSKCENKDSIDFRFNYVGSSKQHVGYDGTSITEF